MDEVRRFSCYRDGEVITADGKMVRFTCASEDVEKVRDFFATHVRSIERTLTGRIWDLEGRGHGYSRYDIVQHKYAGGGSGYIRVLEIRNPPDGRWGFVIEMFDGWAGTMFTEWDTIEQACVAYEAYWGTRDLQEKLPTLEGFRRQVNCGVLTPWFLAIGNEQLVGDYTFPHDLQDDSVFRFGKRFIVTSFEGVPAIKTCMGTRFIKRMTGSYPQREEVYRLVYWDDGSVWDDRSSSSKRPRPLHGGELWITEALRKFMHILTGKGTELRIDFTNGDRFTGKLNRPKQCTHHLEGRYFVVVRVKGKNTYNEGWVDFKPTVELPNVAQYVAHLAREKGTEIEYLEVKQYQAQQGGKKWPGVFFSPTP